MIIGFSEGYHDAALAVIDQNKVVFASHSERYSKKKNDKYLHDGLLDIARQIDAKDIAFYEKPWLKKTRQLCAGQLRKISSDRKLSLKPTHYFSHHLTHAATAFQTSPFERSTVIIVDSIGEWDTVSIWNAAYDSSGKARYNKVWSRKYPYSLGLFYSAITDRVGLKPNEEEYVLMAMASFGKGSCLTNDMTNQLRYRNNHRGCRSFYEECEIFDLATNAQIVLENELFDIFEKALQLSPCRDICYGGGVALNCKANAKLRKLVDRMWIFPNPGDAGSAIGCAALVYGKRLDFNNAFLGYNIDRPYPVKELLDELSMGGIVGVANGRAEFSPRALGNRSLLADPRAKETKDTVNRIKQRQEFRPFSPVVLEEDASDWFDLAEPSPYMQYAVQCKRANIIPAVCHVDGSARVQTVGKDNSGIRKLLEEWKKLTGIPVLLNTSLNIKGQPIVNDLQDAKEFSSKYQVKVY